MNRICLLSLGAVLFASTAQSQVARLQFSHPRDDLFRRQLQIGDCDIGYKPCDDDDGGCCQLGESCTTTSGVPICAATCNANVRTCSANGVGYCCRFQEQRCDPTDARYCTFGSDGPANTDSAVPAVSVTMDMDESKEMTSNLYNPTSITAPTLESTIASESDETMTAVPTTDGPSTTSDSGEDSSEDADETGDQPAPDAPEEPDAGHHLGSAGYRALGAAGLGLLFGGM